MNDGRLPAGILLIAVALWLLYSAPKLAERMQRWADSFPDRMRHFMVGPTLSDKEILPRLIPFVFLVVGVGMVVSEFV